MNAHSPKLPGAVAIKRTVAAARAAGLDPAGFEVSPDGSIRVFEARADPAAPANLFDQLEAKGAI